jgi:hypothetical protein
MWERVKVLRRPSVRAPDESQYHSDNGKHRRLMLMYTDIGKEHTHPNGHLQLVDQSVDK